MTKIYDLIDEIKEEEMSENMLNINEMTKEEKEKTASAALNKIRVEMKDEREYSAAKPGIKRLFSRRFSMVAVVMVMVLAFGVVAYATDIFQFGTVGSGETSHTVAAVEGSDQYKAVAEFQEFWEEQWAILEETGGERVPQKAIDEETDRLMEKYNLVPDGKTHNAKSADEAFKEIGTENFLGDNASLFSGKDSLSFYSDANRVGLTGGDDKYYYELHSTPDNVARFYDTWDDTSAESQFKTVTEWDIISDEGIAGKCIVQKWANPIDEDLENGEKEDRICYRYVTYLNGRMVDIFVDSLLADDPYHQSKEEFTEFINGFEFDRI